MQPYIFPYIGYFQLINAVDKFVIYDDVNFIKRGWIHRNNILVNNSANMFTVPLSKPSQNNLINEVELGDLTSWKEKFLKTTEQSYKKAPHFETVFSLLERTFSSGETYIGKLALRSIQEVCFYLEISTEIESSSEVYGNPELKGQERILDICLKEKAEHYINPTGGRELYSKNLFAENGVKLNFIQSEKVIYPQFKNEFVPWLSIIDVLMFN
ncbi:MAG: WbqC family protein, partial [Spirosomaceae bacterium]|nr:WbqC family protein [Spirosomataceae bacterium]